MRKSQFSAEQITTALRQAESGGTPVNESCRKLQVAEANAMPVEENVRWDRRLGTSGGLPCTGLAAF